MNIFKITMLSGVLLAGTATAKAQSADDIIQKNVDAMGGKANWDKINSMKMVGSMSVQGMDISFTETIVNNKGKRDDISAMGMTGYTIITPKEGWMYLPFQPGMDKVTPMPAEQLKMAQEQLSIKAGKFADKDKISKAEYLGKDTVNSIACYKVKITDKDGNVKTSFFDVTTYYMVRMETTVKVKDQEQEMAFSFSNFKKQPQGVILPMTASSPFGVGDVTFKSIEINIPVNESIFKPSTPEKESKKK